MATPQITTPLAPVAVEFHHAVYMGDHSEFVTKAYAYDPTETVEALAARIFADTASRNLDPEAYLIIRPVVPIIESGDKPW